MILLCHENNIVVSVSNSLDGYAVAIKSKKPSKALLEIAQKYPEDLVIWYHISQQENLNFGSFNDIFHHKKIMASFHPNENYLLDAIGYVDQSPFIKVPKNVSYPTFQMSSLVGGVHASVLNCNPIKNSDTDLDFFLNSFAKQFMRVGLLCYSDPSLLLEDQVATNNKSDFYDLFRFIKQHYKFKWVFLLFANLLIYEKRVKMLPLVYSLFFKRKFQKDHVLDSIVVRSAKNTISEQTIDVIIPTIGRKKYLYDVLKDLSAQTHLPVNVIIIEQNPLPGSSTELDYLTSEQWPFNVDHTFTHQAGACNARNIALSKVKSEWVFLNDDDNRFCKTLLEDVFKNITQYGVQSLTSCYILATEKKLFFNTVQSGIFGSGNSFIKSSLLSKISFDRKFEFGYGEDNDYGCQIRNTGHDIIYFPNLEITHLKAPAGGFRIPHVFEWSSDVVAPKPSPTIMLFKKKNMTSKQILGYKTIIFLSLYRFNLFKTPFYCKQWERSAYWANNLGVKKDS